MFVVLYKKDTNTLTGDDYGPNFSSILYTLLDKVRSVIESIVKPNMETAELTKDLIIQIQNFRQHGYVGLLMSSVHNISNSYLMYLQLEKHFTI